MGNQIIAKPNMYYTNCHRIIYNVETCKNKKKEESIVVLDEVNTQAAKLLRPLNYPCHIYGIVGHKLTNFFKFGEMQTMFKDKGGENIENKPIVEVKVANVLVNMVDVHVTTLIQICVFKFLFIY